MPKLLVKSDLVGCGRVDCSWDRDGVACEARLSADDDVSELRGKSNVIMVVNLSSVICFLFGSEIE